MPLDHFSRVLPDQMNGTGRVIGALGQPHQTASHQSGAIGRAYHVEQGDIGNRAREPDSRRRAPLGHEPGQTEERDDLGNRWQGHTGLFGEGVKTPHGAAPSEVSGREPLHDPHRILAVARVERGLRQLGDECRPALSSLHGHAR
jgi:hypothetical protein